MGHPIPRLRNVRRLTAANTYVRCTAQQGDILGDSGLFTWLGCPCRQRTASSGVPQGFAAQGNWEGCRKIPGAAPLPIAIPPPIAALGDCLVAAGSP